MKSVISDAQFTEAVYRHYNGATLTEIADHFGIRISTLSETRKRRREEWDRIRDHLIEGDLARLKSEASGLDALNREIMTHLLSLVSVLTPYDDILASLQDVYNLTSDECQIYITLFELHLPVRIPRPNTPEDNKL